MVRVPRNPGDFPTPLKLEALKKLPPKHRNREALEKISITASLVVTALLSIC